MSKTPAEKLRKAERRAERAQRVLAARRRELNLGGIAPGAAVDLAAEAVFPSPGRPSSPLPVPGPFDETLMVKAAAGDEVAAELLRKRGTGSIYAAQARHVLKNCTDPGQRSYAAGLLAQLDESFDEYGPQPRPGAL